MKPREHQIIEKLYLKMPGAPAVPTDDGVRMWGNVEGNKHWRFCEAVVLMAIEAAQAYAR